MTDLRNHDWASDPSFDSAVIRHGFTTHMRDYDVVIEVPALRPDGNGSYVEGRYRYRFTHCVEAAVKTKVPGDTWRESWSEVFIDYAAWQQAGEPSGFVWGVTAHEGRDRAVRTAAASSAIPARIAGSETWP